MEIRRINANIPSKEIEKSKVFYGDFLGMSLVMDMKWILTFASASNPTAQISIVQNDNPVKADHGITLTIEIADLDSIYAKAIALGYKIVYPITNEAWGVRRFAVTDPNGVVINLMCHFHP